MKGRRVIGVLVDPVSLDLVTWRYDAFPGLRRVQLKSRGLSPSTFLARTLVHRQNLGEEQTPITILRHDGVPGRTISFEISSDAAPVMLLVDGNRTVDEIAALFNRDATSESTDEIVRAFSQYFELGLLNWRDRNS